MNKIPNTLSKLNIDKIVNKKESINTIKRSNVNSLEGRDLNTSQR